MARMVPEMNDSERTDPTVRADLQEGEKVLLWERIEEGRPVWVEAEVVDREERRARVLQAGGTRPAGICGAIRGSPLHVLRHGGHGCGDLWRCVST